MLGLPSTLLRKDEYAAYVRRSECPGETADLGGGRLPPENWPRNPACHRARTRVLADVDGSVSGRRRSAIPATCHAVWNWAVANQPTRRPSRTRFSYATRARPFTQSACRNATGFLRNYRLSECESGMVSGLSSASTMKTASRLAG
jgi:hypothetical protein